MTADLTQFVRDAVAAHAALDGFDARQTIHAGEARVEAAVRVAPRGRITVQYDAYSDPLAELEDALSGSTEYLPDDITGLTLTFDGSHTWVHDRGRDLVIRKPGRVIYSPFRGSYPLGELGFLSTLIHDFLLRDLGEKEVLGTAARVVGLRPKQRARSMVLKEEFFPVRSASIAFDIANRFPLRIEIRPSRDAPLALLLPPSATVTIEFRNPRLEVPAAERFDFEPPAGSRLFLEEMVSHDRLGDAVPFPFAQAPLEAAGFRPSGDALLASDPSHERAYLTARFERRPPEETDSAEHLTVRVGNYLSPNMGRRRALLAEHGEDAEIPAEHARILDRTARLGEGKAATWAPTFTELGWETGDQFWFLLGEGVAASELAALARALLSDHGAAPAHDAPADEPRAGT